MNTATLVLAVAVFSNIPKSENINEIDVSYCSVIEFNKTPHFCQVIFWDSDLYVKDWMYYNNNCKVKIFDDHITWVDKRTRRLKKVYFDKIINSVSTNDPEADNRRFCPLQERIPLFFKPLESDSLTKI